MSGPKGITCATLFVARSIFTSFAPPGRRPPFSATRDQYPEVILIVHDHALHTHPALRRVAILCVPGLVRAGLEHAGGGDLGDGERMRVVPIGEIDKDPPGLRRYADARHLLGGKSRDVLEFGSSCAQSSGAARKAAAARRSDFRYGCIARAGSECVRVGRIRLLLLLNLPLLVRDEMGVGGRCKSKCSNLRGAWNDQLIYFRTGGPGTTFFRWRRRSLGQRCRRGSGGSAGASFSSLRRYW